MKLPSEIRFVDEKLREAFYSLKNGNDSERELFKNISLALDNIEINAFCGIQVPKKLIPKEYDIKNLWKYNLPNGWRLMYSILSDEVIVVSLVLEWFDHKNYSHRFNY
jgi:hypothetical protein